MSPPSAPYWRPRTPLTPPPTSFLSAGGGLYVAPHSLRTECRRRSRDLEAKEIDLRWRESVAGHTSASAQTRPSCTPRDLALRREVEDEYTRGCRVSLSRNALGLGCRVRRSTLETRSCRPGPAANCAPSRLASVPRRGPVLATGGVWSRSLVWFAATTKPAIHSTDDHETERRLSHTSFAPQAAVALLDRVITACRHSPTDVLFPQAGVWVYTDRRQIDNYPTAPVRCAGAVCA